MQAVRSVGLDRLKRFVCLLLIFVLLFCFFMCPRASAVALEATTIAYGGLLIGTILVGAGVVFSSHGDMVKVGNAMYKTLVNGSSAIGNTISSISAWAVEHGTSLAKGALRVGKDLYQGIVDAFNASYSGGKFLINDYFDTITTSNGRAFCDAFNNMRVSEVDLAFDNGNVWSLRLTESKKGYGRIDWYINEVWKDRTILDSSNFWDYSIFLHIDRDYGTLSFCFGSYYSGDHVSSCGGFVSMERAPAVVSTSVPIQVGTVSVPQPDLVYPSDNTLVRMPDIPSVDTATGDITYPSDAAYTKDAVAVPYPVDTEGVKVPDIPYDKVVDQSTGKTLDDTDTGTDTDNPSKPGEGTDTDNPSDSVNWPSAGDISLPKLIISKFPFCIPFDVARLIGLLEADPKTPVFHVPLKVGTILDEEIVLDLSQWDNAVRIIRWGELIVFVAGLVLVTRNYIKW